MSGLRLPRPRILLRWLAVLLGVLLVVIYILVPLGFGYLATHYPRSHAAGGAPPNAEEITLTTYDHVDLSAWYIPPQNGVGIILVHGAGGNKGDLLPYAQILVEHGYGTLLLELRGHGDSQGDVMAFGWTSKPDIQAAIDYLNAQEEVDAIGALGLSLGAEVLLQATAQNDAIQAVIADGASYRSFDDFWQSQNTWKWVMAPMQWVTQQAMQAFSGESPPPRLVDLIPEIAPRAVFLIAAGGEESEIDYNETYFELAGDPKQYWVVPQAAHVGGLQAAHKEYEDRVITFFDAHTLSIR